MVEGCSAPLDPACLFDAGLDGSTYYRGLKVAACLHRPRGTVVVSRRGHNRNMPAKRVRFECFDPEHPDVGTIEYLNQYLTHLPAVGLFRFRNDAEFEVLSPAELNARFPTPIGGTTISHFFITHPDRATFEIPVIKGDVIEQPCFAHIVNSLCVRPHGLSEHVEKKLPWAKIYGARKSYRRRNFAVAEDRPEMGGIVVKEKDGRMVIGLVGQRDFGRPNFGREFRSSKTDTHPERLVWFREALTKALDEAHARGFRQLALPYRVGCGLAGGDWPKYQRQMYTLARSKMLVIIQKD